MQPYSPLQRFDDNKFYNNYAFSFEDVHVKDVLRNKLLQVSIFNFAMELVY